MLNKVAFAEKTNVLKDIMLEQWKKLFTQVESGEGVTVVERKKKQNILYICTKFTINNQKKDSKNYDSDATKSCSLRLYMQFKRMCKKQRAWIF